MTTITEISKNFGGTLKGDSYRKAMDAHIKPIARAMVNAVKSGEDPLQIPIGGEPASKGQNCIPDHHIARFHCVKFHFYIRACVDSTHNRHFKVLRRWLEKRHLPGAFATRHQAHRQGYVCCC